MDRETEADRRRLERLAAVRRLANRSDTDTALDALLDAAADVAGADEAAIFLYDPASGRIVNTRSSTSPHGGRAVFALGEGVAGQVAATGQGIVVRDGLLSSEVATLGLTDPPRSLLCLPIVAEHSLHGVLSLVAFERPEAWDTSDLERLAPYADEAAAILVESHLREQLHARTEEIELLTSMNAIAPRFERQQYVLGQLANVIAELVHAEACAFLLPDDEGQFVLQAGFNVRGGERAMLAPSLHRAFSAGEMFVGDPSSGVVLPFSWMRELAGGEIVMLPFRIEAGLGLLYVHIPPGTRLDANGRQALRLAAAQSAHLIDNMHLYRSLQASYIDAVATLAGSIEARDALTKGHSEAVSRYALAFGAVLGLDSWLLESLRMSALLHDVGKIAVPDAILLKPGPLSNEEWEIMRRHPEFGEKIIRSLPIAERLRPAVLYHHERWDGSGYPHRLAGEKIPLIARITAIVDAYQVIVAPRPYKHARAMHEAVAEIARCAGSHFDPELARLFCENILTIDPERAARESYPGYDGAYGELRRSA